MERRRNIHCLRIRVPLKGILSNETRTTVSGLLMLARVAVFKENLPSFIPMDQAQGSDPEGGCVRTILTHESPEEEIWIAEASMDECHRRGDGKGTGGDAVRLAGGSHPPGYGKEGKTPLSCVPWLLWNSSMKFWTASLKIPRRSGCATGLWDGPGCIVRRKRDNSSLTGSACHQRLKYRGSGRS